MTQEINQPAITFLNMTGDITISWDASNEDAMLALVQQKMKEGYSFFIMKPRFLSILGKKKVRATSIEEIADAGAAVVDDADFHRMMDRLKLHDTAVEAAVASGKAQLTKSDGQVDRDTIRRAKTPAEVVRHQTLAVRPIVGG
ncbi:hypothetical protein WJ96_07745 [Burkholderia ubonensis]|uniref:Uncharacterized protein n=1 Tax=Burkholderia ubonensis TaxID=101571 RepID=A0AAW3MXZ9_9BURK|nr:hypothetical protein [Burkholderia ubonensis]KVP75593.1 hypothetical protein WJ93_09545 [Burkholderia ubonensis]KVP98405.1 hypothetical protein WJ96_07745 [Burkholderia ubonensis]KVZ93104.1 hypothetical protein WL25_19410 [Burkholderia ubonensis]